MNFNNNIKLNQQPCSTIPFLENALDWVTGLFDLLTLKLIKRHFILAIFIALGLSSFALPSQAAPLLFNDVNVVDNKDGYDIVIRFLSPLFYESHSPVQEGKNLEIQLRQSTNGLAQGSAEETENGINWDGVFDVPLIDVNLIDTQSDSPRLVLRFSKKVNFQIHPGGDSRSITVSLTTDRPVFTGVPAVEVERSAPENLITSLKVIDPNMASRLDRANEAMLDKDYSRAVQLFTRIREEGNNDIKPHVQELMGLAREYNGQFAHAKAEYEKYLQDFPVGDAAVRVQQRLTAMMTAKEAIKPSRENFAAGKQPKTTAWRTQYYGDLGQFYFRVENKRPNQDSEVARSDVNNYFNFMARANNEKYDLKAQLSGNYLKDLLPEAERDQFYPSRISIDARQKEWGLYARLGRQTRQSGGVLGRFDGIHAAYDINPIFTLNVVAGYPVDIVEREKINSDQTFYGASLDISSLWEGWEFSTFYITQDYLDIKDRESVGAEVQYFDATKSFFSLVDYDVYHQELNMFLARGHWAFTPNTTLNLSYDQRHSPILLTTNAIQGQGVTNLEDLFDIYSLDEILQLAKDRSATMQSANLGLTQKLTESWQLDVNALMTEYGGTSASPNVAAIAASDTDFYYTARLIGNGVLINTDSLILGVRYADTERAQMSTFEAQWRTNVTSKLRVNPRVRADYRQNNLNDNDRWLIRPTLKVDYKINKTVKCELDVGYDWMQESFAAQTELYTGYYLRAGYWVQF